MRTPAFLTVLRIWETFSKPGNEALQESISAFLKSSSTKGGKPTRFVDIADNSGFSLRKLPKRPKIGVFSSVVVLATNLGAQTLREIEVITGDPQASISARLRDFRNHDYLKQFLVMDGRRRGNEKRGI